MQEMELVVNFISTFVMEGFELPNPKGDVMYDLSDLELALNFALISEGILKSDKVFDYANILSVRLHSLANSSSKEYFKYDRLVTRGGYITDLLTSDGGKKAQLVDFNINYVDDRLAKVMTKIISKILFDYSINSDARGKFPFHIIIEEAHRYVQNDKDAELLGYNIFDRITKEGRKYGVLLGLITQRPSELSETSISQCSNFLVLRTLHPKDLQYIKEMVPNVSEEVLQILKTLQPGNAIAFGSAFKVPVSLKMEKPNPQPYSSNSDVAKIWYALN
jgi:DNA helicase HerA-like ATPase